MADAKLEQVRLHDSWKLRLASEFSAGYMAELRNFLAQRKQQGATVFPPGPKIFNALDSAPFEQVRVVILGQDPYHGRGQAHGLCFSVPRGVAVPPSLRNIFAEIEIDLGIDRPSHGDLSTWARQGVLLLNAVLTVEQQQAGSHQGKGWERFTDRIVAELSKEREHLVFLLWGSHAQKKGQVIDASKHLVLRAPHPSPLSAHRGFFGCRHFSAANEYLQQHGVEPIDWRLPA